MTNCNDCLHEAVCDYSSRRLWSIMAGERECDDFIDRTKVEEVIRCKDCKHWDLGACLKIYSDGAVNKDAWQFREAEDFCSYGKRRSEIDENT